MAGLDASQNPLKRSASESERPFPTNTEILARNQGSTPEDRSELIALISRGAGRNQLEEAASRLKKNLTSASPDLHDCLTKLVAVLVATEMGTIQNMAVRIATSAVSKLFKEQIMNAAFEGDAPPEYRSKAERQLPSLDILNKLQLNRDSALLRHDLTTVSYFLEQLGKFADIPKNAQLREEKVGSINRLLETILRKDYSQILSSQMLKTVREILQDPGLNATANATLLLSYYTQLPSVDTVGQNCIKLLRNQDCELGSIQQMDLPDRTRVRIGAARVLKEFKHISASVRSDFSSTAGELLRTLENAPPPESHLHTVLTREAA